MDAQNAAEADQTRPARASSPQPRRPSSDKSPPTANLRPPSPARAAAAAGAASGASPGPPPGPPPGAAAGAAAGAVTASDDAPSAARPDEPPRDRDSDAETIVLPGKDGHSPSKARKVRQEDRSESDGEAAKTRPRPDGSDADRPVPACSGAGAGAGADARAGAGGAGAEAGAPGNRPGDPAKRKRLLAAGSSSLDKDRRPRNKEGGSSGLSSAPASPPHHLQHHHHHPSHKQLNLHSHRPRRRSDAAHSSPSDSEQQHHHKASSKASLRDKLKAAERLVPYKRKAPKVESDDEADVRKARRQRTTSAGLDGARPSKEARSTPAKPQHDHRTRSVSPQPRQHRRSISTQLPTQPPANGLNPKKRRLPPPLQSTDYHSDDSSPGGSPHPRGQNKPRSLATPATAEATVSPARMAPHKKHLDAHGQTLLARACARGEYETAKQRLGERPEDLNVADYAGNTPLQIAAIHGREAIVKLLVDAGCNLDCVNYDKDTPLLDAVDNGHLGVVKLLLDADVNPRKANVSGEEPLDRVRDKHANADEIRAVLMAARKRAGQRHRTSEDLHSHHDPHDARDSHSPHRSPAAAAPPSTGRRSGTVRSTKTRNDLLYTTHDDKTLRQAAGRGDQETVAHILQVREGCNDPESMVAAARGGHDLVIELLLGLGGANADPSPVLSLPSEFATPMLAAIGQENIKVVELLLEQQGFDATRRFRGETYYEIARRRQGTNWKEEEHILKNAYDEYKRSHKDATKPNKSPGARRERERERDRDEKLPRRDDAKESSRSHRRNPSSPFREGEAKKKATASAAAAATTKITSPREKRRSDSFTTRGDDDSQKRAPARPKKDSSNVSDREISPTLPHKPPKAKRPESDLNGMSSEGEAIKPRRKLVSKGELSRERDKQKRALKEPSSPRESRNDDVPDKSKLSERYHDRTKALRRDELREHASGDGASKRHRTSVTPDRASEADKDQGEGSVKRRRLDGDAQADKKPKRRASVDGRARKSGSSRDASAKPAGAGKRERGEGSRESQDQRDVSHHGSSRTSGGEKSIHVKSEDTDMVMLDIEQPEFADKLEPLKARQAADEQAKKKEAAEEASRKEEERKRLEAEEKKKKKKREDEEKARKAEEERRKREEEEARKRQEQEERERREAEEEEKKRLEEAKRKKEEEERIRREEEERLRREQLAEEARKQREEEERKERERRDRAHREELERRRAAREAELRRIREEQERVRLDKLPPLLRWFDTVANPKTPGLALMFRNMIGARHDTIRPEATGTPEGRELWVLNTHVALVLGEKDLDLSRYTAWERQPASWLAKYSLWKTEWIHYALLSPRLWEIGLQLPGYYGDVGPDSISLEGQKRLKNEAWERFAAMDTFFVKVSDLLYTVPHIPHLRDIELSVEYKELAESKEQAFGFKSLQKWKQDPDAERYFGFSPRRKYYVNGRFVREDLPSLHQTSKTPFPEARVPRRGLVRVFPDDPDYERICREQGLEHLLVDGLQTSPLPNGVHPSSPASQAAATPAAPLVNGVDEQSATHDYEANGAVATDGATLNGVNDSSNGS